VLEAGDLTLLAAVNGAGGDAEGPRLMRHGVAAASGAYWGMRETRAETLRRRIAFYRRCLERGVNADLVRVYLFEIGEAELELAELPNAPELGKLTCARYAPPSEHPSPAFN
jgi:hypothetical protein